MDFSHCPPDLPLGEKKDLGDGKVIYSFKKSQHVRLLLRNLAEMQAKGVQTDLIVETKSKDLKEPFHSELLAACSPSMKQALAGTNYDLTSAISLGHITANQLKAFRDFLYKPETILDEEIVADLEQFAKKYRVHSLAQLCGQRKHQREGAEGMTVWAKHYEDLLAQLYEMFQKRELTKAILKGDEESCEIPVHGPLIGAASPVFRDMFCNELFCQKGQKYRLRGLSSNTLNCLLRYIYTGEVTVDGATVQDLLQNSCTYKIPAIISACCDWLSPSMSAYNANFWDMLRETESEGLLGQKFRGMSLIYYH
ncbi:PREDICTED: kelch-like protein 3 [Acropora digitifera]|uniref:kelch-like protein 3 n=1 Tax=Acropora digitifera TaxID=70779 RepID=UPI00077ACD77|nr:PREDICTED: kelch-like protein 3 [Acropora digitifera]